MIWFACKQCGKRHGREENQAGMLIFCECGQGNRVPWSSTAEEPEPEEALPVPPLHPRLPPSSEDESQPEPVRPQTRRWNRRRQLNPVYCLNHDQTPKEATCDACHCSFCSACVVALQGQTLCGPCKNFRLSSLGRPAHLSPLAIVSFVLALVGTVVSLMLCYMAIGFTIQMESSLIVAIPCCTIVLFLAVGELVVSGVALRQLDRQQVLAGRGLAMTGATAGLTGIVWAVALALFMVLRQVQG